ncbi:NUDIX domain-containing protein [Saccharopolyspora hattusasensis]|uniref:NUDIX domain-containing protein n=1 Tax=Saccharopolyspora hattusasensis TaxID=1128679 RepID=UPI003D99F902
MGEDVLHAAAREAAEEVGVLIDPADLDHVHTVHVAGSGPDSRIGLLFTARQWIGEPTNREPDKGWSLGWFACPAPRHGPVPGCRDRGLPHGTRFGWPTSTSGPTLA